MPECERCFKKDVPLFPYIRKGKKKGVGLMCRPCKNLLAQRLQDELDMAGFGKVGDDGNERRN